MACTASKVMPKYFGLRVDECQEYLTCKHRTFQSHEENLDILAAAEQILGNQIDVVKRAFEGTSSKQHVTDMSFAQELVMMPPFCKDSAALPTVIKGIHTKVVARKGGNHSSDPLNASSTSESPPESFSVSAPARKPNLPQRPSSEQLKESLPMQVHKPLGPRDHVPGDCDSSKSTTPRDGALRAREYEQAIEARPVVDKAFKEKPPPQVGVGAHFEKVGKDFSIRSLVKGGPAARTGQMSIGDTLILIDGTKPDDRGMYELSKRLLGVEGSTVELTLQRAANAQIYVVSVVRKDMARQSARGLGNMNRRNILRDENSVVIL